jgi:hypothetical protein
MLSALPTHQSQSKSRQNNHNTFIERRKKYFLENCKKNKTKTHKKKKKQTLNLCMKKENISAVSSKAVVV